MQNIGIDLADFEYIRKNNLIYVDKTEYLYKIVSENKYYFLSRPRRFGKTLFVDTLEKFYQGKKDLFEGLYISNQDLDWEKHPVIRLDFNEIISQTTEQLKIVLTEKLIDYANQYNLELTSTYVPTKFNELIKKISKKTKHGVVLLVDEYDKPILSHFGVIEGSINKIRTARANQTFLKLIYDNLKPLEPYLEKVFITGVTKFSKLSIFSTLNNLIELDQNEEFAEIMGYTEKELDEYFSPYFSKLAEKNNLTIPECRNKFKQMYNGFRFTEKDSRVYNPFSVGNALKNADFDNYWFESGTPTFLVELIKNKNFDLSNLENIEVGKNEIKAYNIENLGIIPLLFQTGYLTIKTVEDQMIYKLGYPNNEVESGFNLNLAKSFSQNKITVPVIHRLKKLLINKNLEEFIEQIKSVFAGLVNINIPKSLQDREAYYNSIFYLVVNLLTDNNLNVYSEALTSEGRIDSIVETENNIYIIEFKANQTAEKALQQIKDKNYADRFKIKDKELVLVGINFDTEKRNIKDIKIEETD